MSAFKDQLPDPYEATYSPPFQRHSGPSLSASKSIANHAGALQQRVLNYLGQNPQGATDEAMGEALMLPGNTLRPRRRELQQAGLVKDSGRYSLTRSGRRATVWVLKSQSDPAGHFGVPSP